MEKALFETPQICITNLRVIFQGQDYPLPEIRSVQQTIRCKTGWVWPIAGFVLGFGGGLIGVAWHLPKLLAACSVLTLLVVLFALLNTASYTITLETNQGRFKIVQSRNGEFVSAVMLALNNAMAQRPAGHGQQK